MPFTPSTEQVRSHYVFNQSDQWDPERGEAFDAWLAEHDAEKDAQIDDLANRLSLFLDNCTGGLLAKTGYDVNTMILHTEEYYERRYVEQAEESWNEGHDAARTFYAGGPKEENPYRQIREESRA